VSAPVEADDRQRRRDQKHCAAAVHRGKPQVRRRVPKQVLIGIGLAEFDEFGEASSRELCCHEENPSWQAPDVFNSAWRL
jgi:hypothetical protein